MKYGDRLEWKGLCKTHSGIVAKGENGEPIVKMEDGKVFLLKDVKNSKSLKVIMV
jgi:hypothetical protein